MAQTLRSRPNHQANGHSSVQSNGSSRSQVRIVGIGASAGGLEAFSELLPNLPLDAGVAYVLVQHLDPTHRSLLSEILGKTTGIPVSEITDNTKVEPDRIYVIPPNCDLAVEQGVLKLSPREKSRGAARSIDHFLASLAREQQENAIGVILSGAGSDGAQGLKAIKDAGGTTFAQDPESSRYDSMPRSATGTGSVDFVLTPQKIALEIARVIRQPSHSKSRAAANAKRRRNQGLTTRTGRAMSRLMPPGISWPASPEDINLRKIFVLLRTRTGVDFNFYKANTIRRRMQRRMGLLKIKTLDAYFKHLRDNPAEIECLYQDLLINVSSFFRNPGVFDYLRRKVFPRLVKERGSADVLRFWVAGCSLGQEAYSLAMAYAEFTAQTGAAPKLQIFATDANPRVLEQARLGRFSKPQMAGLSAQRQQHFFAREEGFYRVQKSLRDSVIFAQQNLITDPPFTRVDLISCRNLLIYIEPVLQQKILPTFHYALRPGGYLVLGTSESVGQFTSLFEPLDKSSRVYARKAAATQLHWEHGKITTTSRRAPVPAQQSQAAVEFSVSDAHKEADRLILNKYAPVSVLVNDEGEILQFRGDTGKYLALPSGKANFQIIKMAREGLQLPLHRALEKARKTHRNIKERNARCGRFGSVDIEVVPLKNLKALCFLVLFDKRAASSKRSQRQMQQPLVVSREGGRTDSRQLVQLREELRETRERLESLQEDHETSVEELQASNEEIQSANEELQSLNEELETSNEELESANEELTTLNEELATRNTELRQSEQRLREQAQLLDLAPVLARSPKNRIVFWNRGAEQLYGYTAEEALGQISHLLLHAQFPDPLPVIEEALYRDGYWKGELLHRRKDGKVIWLHSQWVVHRDEANNVRAILEVNSDITARKDAERALLQTEEFNRSILETSPDCIHVLDLKGNITFMTPACQKLVGHADARGPIYWPALWERENRHHAEAAVQQAVHGESSRFEATCLPNGERSWWDVLLQPIIGPDRKPERILAVARDMTAQRQAEIIRHATEAERGRLFAQTSEARGEVEILNEIGRKLSAELDLEKLTQAVIDAATRLSKAEFGAIFYTLLHQKGQREHFCAYSAPGRENIARISVPQQTAAINRKLFEAGAVRHANISVETTLPPCIPPAGLPEPHPAVKSCMAVPIISRGGEILGGVFLAHSTAAVFSDWEERIVLGLASQASVAMENARLFGHLEAEVQERTARLQETISEIQAFSYTVSHDLRSPLRAMQSYAQILLEDYASQLDDKARHYLSRIAHAGIRLDRLIQDVLTYGKISRNQLRLVPIDLDKLIADLINQYPSFQPPHAEIRVEGPLPEVLGDLSSATQCLSNLLGNAVKFVPAATHPLVRIHAEPQGERVRLWLSDNGIGIAPEHHERIFRMFERVHGASEYEGTGIGLAIVRKAMERMGGAVGLISEPGKGSDFWLEFRQAPPDQPA
jgi:PAS domain S-box-containing protein